MSSLHEASGSGDDAPVNGEAVDEHGYGDHQRAEGEANGGGEHGMISDMLAEARREVREEEINGDAGEDGYFNLRHKTQTEQDPELQRQDGEDTVSMSDALSNDGTARAPSPVASFVSTPDDTPSVHVRYLSPIS